MNELILQRKTHQIWIKPGHKLYPYFQELCCNSKNLYNTTNFYIRQVYTAFRQTKELQPLQREALETIDKQIDQMNETQTTAYLKRLETQAPGSDDDSNKCNLFVAPSNDRPYVSYNFLDSLFKCMSQPDYRSLPTQSSQGIMKVVFQNWKSYYQSLKEYHAHPERFKAKPNIPRYCRNQHKEIIFTNQDCVVKNEKYLKFPLTKVMLDIGKLGATSQKLKQVRVIPRYGRFVVEIVMEADIEPPAALDPTRCMALDLGVDNLAAITTNTGMKPTLVKGRHIKSINQYYNKEKARLTGILRQGKNPKEGQHTSKRLENLHMNRSLKIKDLFHKASFHIVQLAIQENIGTIIIGINPGWKQEINIGRKNNQTFCHIPHSLLIDMIQYKAERYGIKVIINEESYTSKASFLDDDEIPTYGEDNAGVHFSGKRIHRGLYRSANKTLINADVNGSANIMRKVVPNAFCGRDRGVVVSTPLVLNVR